MDNALFTTHGGIPLFGIGISHSWHEIGSVMQVVYEYKVDCFIEIGIHRGGLGALMVPQCLYDPNFLYLGFDIDKDIVEPSFLDLVARTPNAQAVYIDAMSDNALNFTMDFLKNSRQPMLYCDGGNKAGEFDKYSRALPAGSLVMVHDYPKEFKDEDFKDAWWMELLEKDYLNEPANRQKLFMRKS